MISCKLNYKSAIVFLTCILFVSTTKAQYFAEPITDPFGLDSLDYGGRIAFVDLDNDGDQDLLVLNDTFYWNSRMFYYFENIGDVETPLFDAPVESPFGLDTIVNFNYWEKGFDFGDIDNDDDLDLIIGKAIYENVGDSNTPIFDYGSEFNLAFPGSGCENGDFPRLVDLDNDNDLDLIRNYCSLQSVSSYHTHIKYHENIGDENVFLFDSIGFTLFDHIYVNAFQIAAADLDLDEDIDLLLLGLPSLESGYLENTGISEIFYFDTLIYYSFFGLDIDYFYGSPDFADLDNDGDPDLLVNNNGNFLYYEYDQALSISEKNKASEFSIYPNPTANLLHIESEIAIKEIQFIDLLGRSAMQIQNPASSISISTLNTGLYMVKIIFEDGNIALKKILKD